MKGNASKVLLLCLVLALLYGLVYYQFIWTAKFDPKIEELNSQLQVVKREKEILDRDLANIGTIKRNIDILNVQDERFNAYLMNESNVSDSIGYIDNLDRLFGGRFEKVNFKSPSKKTSNDKKRDYYEFGLEFETMLTLGETINLIDYLEGASKKISIPNFVIKPNTDKLKEERFYALINQEKDSENPIELYEVKMSISIYSLDLGNADKIYEYSQRRFNRVHDNDELQFSPFIGMTIEPGILDTTVIGNIQRPAGGSSTSAVPAFVESVDINLYSFMSGGHNFVIRNMEDDKVISFKTKITPQITLTFHGNYIDAYVVGEGGDTKKFTGILSSDVINLNILTKFPVDIVENENLGLSIQVINDSQKPIRVKLDDRNRRATLLDRNGNTITRNSQIENLRLV